MSTDATPTAFSPRLPSPGLFGAWLNERSVGPLIGSIALVALWFLRRRYNGVLHDSMIYMGRGLADLDPRGVGADYFYRLDGQSSFSVFSKIVDALIPAFGLAHSAQLLTVTALVLWLAALAALAAQLASGRLKWAILICVAVASGAYGGLPLQYAEAFATPRPFAEAGVLAALAALLAGSRLQAVFFLGLAALFHPIMALAGAGTLYVYLCLENRRWIYLGLFGALFVLVAALAGLPLFSRLLERFDWNWLILLRLRASFLFPLLWREPAWTTLAVHTATLAFAATAATASIGRLFWSVIVASLGGLLVSVVFGDIYPLVLIVQAQPWRAIWLLTLFGTIALCFCAQRLWAEEGASRASLALLAIAWIGAESTQSALLCVAAIGLHAIRQSLSPQVARLLTYCCATIAALTAAGEMGAHIYTTVAAWKDAQGGVFDLVAASTTTIMLCTPVTALALAWAISDYRVPRPALVGAAAGLAILALATWNGSSEFNRALSMNEHPPELERMVASRPGEVLWVGESQAPWVWLGRPNWVSYLHGAGNVFSRPLAMIWRDRTLALLDVGWIEPSVFTRWMSNASPEKSLPDFTREKIHKICARPDAPAWILGGLASPDALPADVVAQVWRSPTKNVEETVDGAKVWRKVQDVAVIDCSLFGAGKPE
jgi:hypothetical protein